MEVGIYQNGRSIMVKLLADDLAAAAKLADHIRAGAPAGVEVSYQASEVTVVRELDSEADANAWARELHAGMEEGHLDTSNNRCFGD